MLIRGIGSTWMFKKMTLKKIRNLNKPMERMKLYWGQPKRRKRRRKRRN